MNAVSATTPAPFAARGVTWIYWRLLLRRYTTSDLNQPLGMIEALTPT
jgi:hypothetical protein